eukprot:TRINITY_DN3030_c0_g2_i1.p1 TRINITY_DN3030_c0_g2~~TRINITY_DN3030_c0_g2_i1.p1  ORF type:complete len:178 (-),score=20.58 TRINITY_DN3030_c0_g2_i1:82-615(-)
MAPKPVSLGRRRPLATVLALVGVIAFGTETFSFVPSYRVFSESPSKQHVAASRMNDQNVPLESKVSSSFPAALPAFAIVGVAAMLAISSPLPASAVLPENEQKGYIQNLMGYSYLFAGFFLGFAGMVFGPIIRLAEKSLISRIAVIVGAIGFIATLVLILRHVFALDVDPDIDVDLY